MSGLFHTQSLVDEIERRLTLLSERIKTRTGVGLNDDAKWLEPFAARLLNLVYGWKLADPDPGNTTTKGIDLVDLDNKVAVQVSVQEPSKKVSHTKAMLRDGAYTSFTTKAVFFLHHEKLPKEDGLRLINIGTLQGDLMGKEPALP